VGSRKPGAHVAAIPPAPNLAIMISKERSERKRIGRGSAH